MALMPWIRSIRPRSWTKNLVVGIGLGFSGRATQLADVLLTVQVFAAFCLAASSVYLLNDVLDCERDRLHPQKRRRPIAAGQISQSAALQVGALLACLSMLLSYLASSLVFAGIAFYLLLQLAYSTRLKHVVILDVFCIGAGFMLRVLSGVWALGAALSPWLVACSVQLALFLALCKRKAEVTNIDQSGIADRTSFQQRPTLDDYTGPATDVMISVLASSTLVTYALYTFLPAELLQSTPIQSTSQAGTPGLVWTLPIVLYVILRYLYLVYRRDEGERPELLVTSDKPLLIAVLLYLAVTGIVVYGPWTQPATGI